MIIGGHNDIYDVSHFMGGLASAVKGLLRVSANPGHDYSFCSGWLLTDTLVVIPDYAATDTTFFCYPSAPEGEQPQAVQATLLWPDTSSSREGTSPALLRLSKPLPGCAFVPETKSTAVGDPVMVLQQADGALQAHFSLGTITDVEPVWIKYNASTSIGSGGGPIIDTTSWKVIGMHMASLRDERVNRGLRIDPILDALRHSGAWLEIVKHHNLAEAAYTLLETIEVFKPLQVKRRIRTAKAKITEVDDHLTKAALCWSFDPEKVSEKERKELQPLVVDAKASSWTLKTKERQRILRTAGSPEQMQEQVPDETTDETGQTVIKDILKGAPYNLDEIEEEQLSYWLQAVRWFDGIVPGLPSPAEVNTTLERKRTRSKLQNVIRGFRGRKKELGQLLDWYNDANAGPMLITGIGGMGKSALVGYFVNGLPSDTLLLWLDFDRPDLAPDDAVSVLNAIAKQATVQLTGFGSPDIDEENWREDAKELGIRLAAATKKTSSPLMILDGFEVAQHTKEYDEIWQVLEGLLAEVPRLKIIVSGRAPVKSLKLQNKDATPLPLKGLAEPDAEAWLREHGINDDEVLKVVLKLAEGIPLRLKLAVRLVESGEKVKDLPEKLPQEYITGYLYQRILYRVIDPDLIPVVEDILVLRKCSKPMLVKILGDNVPQGLTAEKVYERLSREMALVGDAENLYGSFVVAGNNADKLELRPEVRSATLRLLEQNNKQKVEAMDQKAVDWYRGQDLTDVGNVAELVYHLLRLRKLDEARKVFRIECVPLLRDAINELPEDAQAEHSWLEKKVGAVTDEPTDNLLSWEIQAALDIRSRLGRGLVKDIENILFSRKQRTSESPLLVYDAFNCWQKGELQNAINILKYADEASAAVQRDRNIFHAFLLSQEGNWEAADKLLEILDHGPFFAGATDQMLLLQMVTAARIRLTVDIEAELKLFEALNKFARDGDPKGIDILSLLRRFLPPSDIVTPLLNDLFAKDVIFESFSSILKVPFTDGELTDFRLKLQHERISAAPLAISLEQDVTWDTIQKFRQLTSPDITNEFASEEQNLAYQLAYKGYRRWKLATSQHILGYLCKFILEKQELSAKYFALRGVFVAFRGQPMQFESFSSVDKLLDFSINSTGVIAAEKPSEAGSELLSRYFLLAGIPMIKDLEPGKMFHQLPPRDKGGDQINSLVIYLGSPSPLELLCKTILGLPENYKLIP